MGHISQAWTNLALSQRELRDGPSRWNPTALAVIMYFLRA
jgi:hypothetical protein